MKTVNEIMQSASLLGACAKSNGVSDWRSLTWLFFTPQGREFCEDNNFPSLEMFQGMKDNISEYNILVDAGNISRQNDVNVGLIGNTSAQLVYNDNTEVHKVVLMHGAKARIEAANYAVILLVNIGNCEVEIEKDNTVVIL
ncbi:hypothetical protein [Bacteroides sp.]|uniref:hypothetical protein n=1 Tax=Bacteroides sp. TaxID=29523 RepID=UPI002615F68A|nr:hypothetical protein [Bacteroides sp.]